MINIALSAYDACIALVVDTSDSNELAIHSIRLILIPKRHPLILY